MSCDVGEVTESLENQDELWRRWSDWKLGEWAELFLQAFSHFTYVTAHSPTLLSLLLRHRIFTYVTWRAAYGVRGRRVIEIPGSLIWSKTVMELICNPYSEIRQSPDGPVNQIHTQPSTLWPYWNLSCSIFSDLLKYVKMLKREWDMVSNGKLPHLFIPSLRRKTCLWAEQQPWCLSLHWKTCPWAEHSDDGIYNKHLEIENIIFIIIKGRSGWHVGNVFTNGTEGRGFKPCPERWGEHSHDDEQVQLKTGQVL